MKARILTHATGVDFTNDVGTVAVDASAHTIRLKAGRAERELGASRAALLTAMGVVAEELGLPQMGHDLTPAARAIEDALARNSGERDAAVERAVGDIYPTPIVFSAPFLAARFVREDAKRFRACAVAVAHAEDDRLDDDRPETVDDVVAKLARWRDLFARSGTANRAVNAMLQEHGEVLPAAALWGLRRIALTRAHASRRHLEVLGWLGALPHWEGFDAIAALVERAGDDDIEALFDLDRDETPRSIAAVMAEGDPQSKNVMQLVRGAIEEVRRELADGRGALRAPPIALPSAAGVRWLSTAAELRAEGQRMHHCVASYARRCRDGEVFIFHVERGGSHATVEVDAEGAVVQSQGPFNRPSHAASWGRNVLEQWGIALWANRWDPAALCWPLSLPAPTGARPLRNVREVHDAFVAAATARNDGHAKLRDWFHAATSLALAARAGLLRGDSAGAVWAIDAKTGAVIGDAASLALSVRDVDAVPQSAFVRAAPRERPRLPVAYAFAHAGALPAAHVGAHRDVERGAPPDGAARVEGPWRAPALPIAPPRVQGVVHIDERAALQLAEAQFHVDLDAIAAALRDGLGILFRCFLDRGSALVLCDVAARTCTTIARQEAFDDEVARLLERLRSWMHGFWVVRAGAARGTWSGAMRAPAGTEPLLTIADCARCYFAIVERRGDRDGRLAAFFEEHVAAAVRGNAWLVVRDRERGLVSVLDARRRAVASTDAIVA